MSNTLYRSFLSVAIFLSLIVLIAPRVGFAQEASNPSPVPKLTLGDSDGSPGGTVVVPIYFTPVEGLEVGQIQFDVNFVSKNLKYS